MFGFLRKRSHRNEPEVERENAIEFSAKLGQSALVDDLKSLLDEGYDNVHERSENEIMPYGGPRSFRGMWRMEDAYSWFSAVLFLFLCEWVRSQLVWRATSASVLEECRVVLYEWCSRHREERSTTERITTLLYDLWRRAGYPVLVGSMDEMSQRRSFFWSQDLQGALGNSKLSSLLVTMSAGIDGDMAYFREAEVYQRLEELAKANPCA